MTEAEDLRHEVEQLRDELSQLRRERDYYKGHADELSGAAVKRDYEVSTLRHTLKQRQQGFRLLLELQRFIGGQSGLHQIFCHTAGAVNATLGMDRTFILTPLEQRSDSAVTFRPTVAMGTSNR